MSKHVIQDVFFNKDKHIARGKFLSRIFGIFSEEIVRIWAADPLCAYEDLGRPTIRTRSVEKGYTLDFTLREKSTGLIFVTELKCEIEYQNYKYMVLSHPDQLRHHKKPAFDALLQAALNCKDQETFVCGRKIEPDGAILIWGSVTPEGRAAVIRRHAFVEVLSIEQIIEDLCLWENVAYSRHLEERKRWCVELFDGLSF